jgi:hypothetical protein
MVADLPPKQGIIGSNLAWGKREKKRKVLQQMWKSANISPQYKKGSKLSPLNYRPISLTSVPCKILEGVVQDLIMNFLTVNNLLSKN